MVIRFQKELDDRSAPQIDPLHDERILSELLLDYCDLNKLQHLHRIPKNLVGFWSLQQSWHSISLHGLNKIVKSMFYKLRILLFPIRMDPLV